MKPVLISPLGRKILACTKMAPLEVVSKFALRAGVLAPQPRANPRGIRSNGQILRAMRASYIILAEFPRLLKIAIRGFRALRAEAALATESPLGRLRYCRLRLRLSLENSRSSPYGVRI